MKNKTTNYTIKMAAKEIEISRRFEKAANVIGSNEYNTLITLMNDFPQFKVTVKEIKKNKNKKSYKGLTISEMEKFVSRKSDEDLERFQKALAIAKGRQGTYALIKKWFLDRYKEEYANELAVEAA